MDSAPKPTFFHEQGRLIDELRVARATATSLAAMAGPDEASFANEVVERLDDLLDDLGCYD